MATSPRRPDGRDRARQRDVPALDGLHPRAAASGVKRFQDLLTAGGRIYHETHYAPLLRMQGSVREIAVDIVCADGRRLPVLVNSVLLTDDGGRAADGADDALRRDRAQVLRARAARRPRPRARGARADRAPAAHHRRAGGGARRRGDRRRRVDRASWPRRSSPHAGRDRRRRRVAARDVRRGRRAVVPSPDARRARRRPPAAGLRRPARLRGGRARVPASRCAGQTALALERARLYEETRDVAHTLQRSLLAGDAAAGPALRDRARSTSRPSSTWRSAATGTTRSRCPAARSGSSSATWSAAA